MNHAEIAPVENEESDQHIIDYARKKRRIILMLLAYGAASGVILGFLPEDSAVETLVGLPFLVLGIVWCFIDAAERDHRIGGPMKLLMVLLFVVGFPVYLFQTRGLGAFKSLAFALLITAAIFALMFVTGFATMYLGILTGVVDIAI